MSFQWLRSMRIRIFNHDFLENKILKKKNVISFFRFIFVRRIISINHPSWNSLYIHLSFSFCISPWCLWSILVYIRYEIGEEQIDRWQIDRNDEGGRRVRRLIARKRCVDGRVIGKPVPPNIHTWPDFDCYLTYRAFLVPRSGMFHGP